MLHRCAAAETLFSVLGGFLSPSLSPACVTVAFDFIASCRSDCAAAIAGSDDAVLAVRKALQSDPGTDWPLYALIKRTVYKLTISPFVERVT